MSGPLVGRGGANTARWRLQTCSKFAMSRVLKAKLNFDAVARQPGTVGAAVGASFEDGGGGGGELRGDAVSGARDARRRKRDARPT